MRETYLNRGKSVWRTWIIKVAVVKIMFLSRVLLRNAREEKKKTGQAVVMTSPDYLALIRSEPAHI